MALQILVQYQNAPVTYNIVMQEDNFYQLRLDTPLNKQTKNYIPEKIIIRKKGKIWVSDMDNYDELIQALTKEIASINLNN